MVKGTAWLPWALYVPMGAAGAVWAWTSRRAVWSSPQAAWFASEPSLAWTLGLAAAGLTAWGTLWSTRILVRRTQWARRLHLALRAALTGISMPHLATLAALSALAEELFFRAALAPALGMVPAAILFGLAHVSPPGTRFAWTLWATLMGIVFHVLFLGSGHLAVPILAHAIINYENMQYIVNYDPTPLDMDRPQPHGRC